MSIYGSDGGEESMSAGLAKGSTTTSPVFDLWAKLDADQQKYAKIGAAALGESPAAPLPCWSATPFSPADLGMRAGGSGGAAVVARARRERQRHGKLHGRLQHPGVSALDPCASSFEVSKTPLHSNGPLDGCTVAQQGATCDESTGLMTVAGCANEKSIPGWKVNNAVVSVEAQWPHRADGTGRTNIIKVGDAGSFSEIHQTVDTVIGQVYTISYDVWSEESETNTANKVRNVGGNLTRFWHIWGIFCHILAIFKDIFGHGRPPALCSLFEPRAYSC